MIRAHTNLVDRFPQITADLQRRARHAVDAAAEEAARTAAQIGSERGMTEFEVIPAEKTINGWKAGIKGKHWYWRLQSAGTLGRATRPKRPGHKRSHEPGTGITPNRMYEKARTAGRRKLLQVVGKGS